MAPRTASDPMSINPRKIAAGLAQAGSFATTYGCIIALGGTGYKGFFLAVAIEFFLMMGKSMAFDRKSGNDAFGWLAVAADTFLNAGGIWPMVQTLDKAPSWIMLKEGMGLVGDIGKLPALIIALALGYLLAVAPHRLWREK
jgi:hypothetical protein